MPKFRPGVTPGHLSREVEMTQPATEPAIEPATPAEPTTAAAPAVPAAPTPPTPAPAEFKSEHSRESVLKTLAEEREARKVIEAQLTKIASAFGVETKPKGKTDIQVLTERIEAQEARAAAAEMRALRAEVAQEKNLPPKLAARLVGATKEELAADADELLSLLPAGEKPADGKTGETPVEPTKPKPAPDPTQGAKGAAPTARPTSLFDAINRNYTKQ